MAKPKGWVKEPVRHGLAAKGVKTVGKNRRTDALAALKVLLQEERTLEGAQYLEFPGADEQVEEELEQVRGKIVKLEKNLSGSESFEKASVIGYRTAKADALSALHEDLRMLQDEEEDISKELDHEEFLEEEGMSGDDMEMTLLEQDLERVRNEIMGVERSIRVVMKGN